MYNRFVTGFYEYAASCLPTSRPGTDHICYVNIISSEEANITLLTAEESISLILPNGTLYKREFNEASHPTIGAENKAIRIFSDIEIQVLLYQSVDGQPFFDDVYMVPNQFKENTTYFTAAYGSSSWDCGSTWAHQFYLVTSFYDETSLSIVQQDGNTFELELPAFGTFAQKTTDIDDTLGSGTQINSNKPINVMAGNLCVGNPSVGDTAAGIYASSIPGSESVGQQYIVPRITNEDANPPGFSVGVVATEDDTIVESDGVIRSLDQGEAAMFEYSLIDRSVFVNCSRKCLTTQYAKRINHVSGLFMQHMLPDHDFYTRAYFTTLDAYSTSFLSLVVKGESTVDGLYLNGESLQHLTWSPAYGYSTADMAISSGVYELEAEDGRPFAAYIYFHLRNNGGGAGYAMLPMESARVTTTPATTTTATPSSTTITTPNLPTNNTFPQHTARVNGTAFTEDGQEMTPACALVRKQD